jgi:hypothetical protein
MSGDRILWNRRPTGPRDTGDIDEIVVHDCTVHVEQMDERCWWIGVTKAGSDRVHRRQSRPDAVRSDRR